MGRRGERKVKNEKWKEKSEKWRVKSESDLTSFLFNLLGLLVIKKANEISEKRKEKNEKWISIYSDWTKAKLERPSPWGARAWLVSFSPNHSRRQEKVLKGSLPRHTIVMTGDEVIQECPPTTILIIFRLSTINLKNCHGINRLQNRVDLVGNGG
jgi:hypothetical protein